MPASTYLRGKVIDHTLRATSFTSPASVFVSLHTSDPTIAGTPATEVSAAWYARQGITLAAQTVAGQTSNSNTITYNGVTGSSVTVTHFAIWDAATLGNMLDKQPVEREVYSISFIEDMTPTDEIETAWQMVGRTRDTAWDRTVKATDYTATLADDGVQIVALADVYPPAPATGASVELVYASYPPPVEAPAEGSAVDTVVGDISVPDIYSNALQDYVLYRAFSKDSEYAGNAARATAHQNAYIAALTGTAKVE